MLNLLRLTKAWWPPLLLAILLLAYMANSMDWFGPYGGPIGYLLLMGGLLAWLWQQQPTDSPPRVAAYTRQSRSLLYGVWLVGTLLSTVAVVIAIAPHPLDPLKGDIVPTIQVYVQRLLAGERVYQTVYMADKVYEPGYLLFQWLPFVPAELLGLDYRVAAHLYLQLALLILGHRLLRVLPGRWPWLLMAATQLAVFFILRLNPNIYIFTIEPLIYAYYLLLLVWGLGGNRWLAALALLLCLLSRYSLVLWLPVAVVAALRLHGWRHTLWVAGLVLAGVGLFFLVFMAHDPLILVRSQQSYTQSALIEWTQNIWGGRPVHLYFGRGFAVYFYEWGTGSMTSRIQTLQQVHLILVAGSAAVLAVAAFFIPKTKLHWYALLSLALYHTLFLSFLQVPYSYLFGINFWWCWGLLLWAVAHKVAVSASH